jgi:hypothetical protein
MGSGKRRDRWFLFFVALIVVFLAIMGIRAATSDGAVPNNVANKTECHTKSEYARSRSFAFHTTLTWARVSVQYCVKHGAIVWHETTIDQDSPGTGWSLVDMKKKTWFKKAGGIGRATFHVYVTLSFHQTFPVAGEVDTDYMWLRVNVFGNGRGTTDSYEHSPRLAP